MRIAICDDEPIMQKQITDEIEKWLKTSQVEVDILCYPSADAFISAWQDLSFDLTFLDIQLHKKPGKSMSGIELAEYIRKTDKNMLIVFITSFKQYVLSGYDVNALHYLIKPISQAKFLPVMDKAYAIWKSRYNATLLVSDGKGKMKLPFDDIYSISMVSHIANIETENVTYELRKSADEMLEILPTHFIRCHRSFIVNLLKVDCVYKESLLMSNKKTLPISRNNSKAVNDAFVKLHTLR